MKYFLLSIYIFAIVFFVSCKRLDNPVILRSYETCETKLNAIECELDSIGLPALRPETGEMILFRKGYITSYNRDTRLPNWVAWRLTASHLCGENRREGVKFAEDTQVPSPRALLEDYYNSGYDRGHMCPSADCRWDKVAQTQSFLLTNVCPQDHSLNSGDWNELEVMCRHWAREYSLIYIVCGPVINKGEPKKIGRNKVVVPDAFYKVVLCYNDGAKAIGFIMPNRRTNKPLSAYACSVDEVEDITGFDFFAALPDILEDVIEAQVNFSSWNMK